MSRMEGIAGALKEGAEGTYVGLRRVARSVAQELRAQDRYLWWKVGIVASWLGLSLLALQIATAPPIQEPTNSLGAYASVRRTALSWALLIHNRSDRPWTGVRVLLDAGHVFERERMEPDERVVLSPWQFSLDGEAPADDALPREVRIETRGGSASPILVVDPS